MNAWTALDLTVSVRPDPDAIGAEFARLYAACAVPSRCGGTRLELELRATGDSYTLAVDGSAAAEYVDVHTAFLAASVAIDRACVAASSPSHLMVHGSCVAHDGNAALIVGPSGAGKTSLAAALTRAGLEYVGDEVIGFPSGSCGVAGYPKPFKLDQRARDLLRAACGQPDTSALPGERLIAPAEIGGVRPPGERSAVALVVTPVVADGTGARVERMSRADVAELLADQCFNFPAWGGRALARVADVARTCTGVRLTFGDLEAGTAAVQELLT